MIESKPPDVYVTVDRRSFADHYSYQTRRETMKAVLHSFPRSLERLLFVVALLLSDLAHAWVTPTLLSSSSSSIRRPTKTILQSGARNNDETNQAAAALVENQSIRFLGRGTNAVVRPGCVLIAPKHEFHTLYRRSAILIYGMGDAEDGSGDYLVRGVILDNPTPFTLREMMDHQPHVVSNPLGDNFLFRGGDKGGEGVMLLHARPDLERPAIGMSGLYQGGWEQALEICQHDAESRDHFKAFFNYCEFSEQELEDLLDSEEEGDAWVSLEVQPEICLNPDFDRGDAWSLLRNAVRQMEISGP